MEFALRVIARSGIDAREGVQVFNVLGGYIMGVVMMEVGAMFAGGTAAGGKPAHMHAKMGDEVFSSFVPADRLPCITAALPHFADCDPDQQFEFGLDLMLAGIQARVGRR